MAGGWPLRKTRRSSGAIVMAALVAAAGCSSSASKSNGNATGSPGSTGTSAGPSSGGGKTVTVGVLTDETGLAASSSKTSIEGVKAGVVYAARNGYTIKYVVADTETNPATALVGRPEAGDPGSRERRDRPLRDPVSRRPTT